MARKVQRIAPPSMIADAVACLLARIERNPKLNEEQRELKCNAVVKAFNQLYDGVRFTRNGDEFVFPSRTRSGLSHRVNGVCECEAAAEQGQPCWHCAAKYLILVVEEAQQPDAGQPPDEEGLLTSEDAPLPDDDLPRIACPTCDSPMRWAITPGGEECVECLSPKCGRTIHAEVVDAFYS